VLLVGLIGAGQPALLFAAGFGRPLADPLLFGAEWRNEAIIDLAVAVVVFAVTNLGLREDPSFAGAPDSVFAVLHSFFAGGGVQATGAFLAILAETSFIDLTIAVVVFLIAVGLVLFSFFLRDVISRVAFPGFTGKPALLLATNPGRTLANPGLFATGGGRQTVIDLAVAVVVFAVTNLVSFGGISRTGAPGPRSLTGLDTLLADPYLLTTGAGLTHPALCLLYTAPIHTFIA